MRSIHDNRNGSIPRVFPRLEGSIGAPAPTERALSPTVADILPPELRASLRGDGGPSPLWARVLDAAKTLASCEAERALLENTRLDRLDAKLMCVRAAAVKLGTEQERTLRRLLIEAVHLAGLPAYWVELNFTSPRDSGDDEE